MILKEQKKIKPKLNDLKEREKRNGKLYQKIKDIKYKIFENYSILFKNFLKKRIDLDIIIKQKDGYYKKKICLNERGFSFMRKYDINSFYLSSFEELLGVSRMYKKILPYIKSNKKRSLTKKFLKELNKFEDKSRAVNIQFKEKLLEFDDKIELIKKISYNNSLFSLGVDYSLSMNYRTFDNVKDCIKIETFYPQLKKLLDKQEKLLLKKIKKIEEVNEKIKEKFSSELILIELGKEDD